MIANGINISLGSQFVAQNIGDGERSRSSVFILFSVLRDPSFEYIRDLIARPVSKLRILLHHLDANAV